MYIFEAKNSSPATIRDTRSLFRAKQIYHFETFLALLFFPILDEMSVPFFIYKFGDQFEL